MRPSTTIQENQVKLPSCYWHLTWWRWTFCIKRTSNELWIRTSLKKLFPLPIGTHAENTLLQYCKIIDSLPALVSLPKNASLKFFVAFDFINEFVCLWSILEWFRVTFTSETRQTSPFYLNLSSSITHIRGLLCHNQSSADWNSSGEARSSTWLCHGMFRLLWLENRFTSR